MRKPSLIIGLLNLALAVALLVMSVFRHGVFGVQWVGVSIGLLLIGAGCIHNAMRGR